jgi:peptidoglycan/LPS O-acetylase OafA/YrhL
MVIKERFTKLDGLRGLLSIVVALNHSFLILAIPAYADVWGQNIFNFHDLQSKLQQIFMLLGNGGVAVTMFFILSGLVLGGSLSRVQFSPRGLTSFYVKRLLRLYPVYVFVILLIAVYMKRGFVYQVYPHAASWFSWWMRFDMTLKEFIYNFFFIHTYLGGVTWTLRVILIASFIFPLFYLATKKTSKVVDLLITAALIAMSFSVFILPDFRDFRYLYMFFLGLILPKFQSFFASLSHRFILLLAPFALLLLLDIRYMTDEYAGGLIESVISWFVIGLLAYGHQVKVFDFLDGNLLKFFGKISYSLYLIHFSILYILAKLMFDYLPDLPYAEHYVLIHSVLFLISLAVATLVSYLVHIYVESPSSRLAERVGRKIIEE